jgi:hypothetical protein
MLPGFGNKLGLNLLARVVKKVDKSFLAMQKVCSESAAIGSLIVGSKF